MCVYLCMCWRVKENVYHVKFWSICSIFAGPSWSGAKSAADLSRWTTDFKGRIVIIIIIIIIVVVIVIIINYTSDTINTETK